MTKRCLGEVARFINGAAFKPTDWEESGLPIIRIQNLTGTGERFNYTTRQVKPDLIVESGDLLISWSATLDVYRWNGSRGVLNQHIFKVLPASNVDPEYLFYALKSVISELSAKTHGSTMKHVVRGDFESTRLLMPELDEQRRIVDILSRAEGIVRLRREAQKKAAEIIPALFIDMFGDPATNPKGWPMQPLGQLSTFMSGGTPSKARKDFWQGNLPWVSPKDMKKSYLDDAIDHINEKTLAETSIKLVPIGSVLIVVRGMILIHTVPIACSSVPLTINQDMKALVPVPSLHGSYLLWILKVLQPHLLNMVSTAAHGTRKLETSRLEGMMVQLPPLKEQLVFSDRVAEIQSIQYQQSAATQKAEAAFNALLGRAFQGELLASETT